MKSTCRQLAGSVPDLNACSLQGALKLHSIGQRGTGVPGAVQQQHGGNEVGVLRVVQAVCGA